jgi:transposase-like protein
MKIYHSFPRRLRRTNAQRRAQLLAAFNRSGLSGAAFARQYKLNYTTFCGWRHQAKAKAAPGFVQVEMPAALPDAGLMIELGAQARLRLSSASQFGLAVQLLHQFNAHAPC